MNKSSLKEKKKQIEWIIAHLILHANLQTENHKAVVKIFNESVEVIISLFDKEK